MISYIIGQVSGINENGLVLENNGIGYALATSTYSMSHFRVGETYKLYTVLVVREDGLSLYGFYDEEERRAFLLLNRVSSIGPKVALSVLSTLSVEELVGAILNNDPQTLARAPGIGKKTASRIILELVDAVKEWGLVSGPAQTPSMQVNDQENYQVALEALINLGYARNEAESALKDWDRSASLEEGIRYALRRLS